MKKFKNHTLQQYLDVLSAKEPVPGGGSVSALTGSLAVGLLVMVAQYSVDKGQSKPIEGKLKRILKELQVLKGDLLTLVDGDSEAYLKVRATKNAPAKEKRRGQKKA